MSKATKGYLMVVLLSILSLVIVVNWYVTGDPNKFFLLAHKLEVSSDNIEDVTIEFIEGRVFMNVATKKETTCNKVMKTLGVNDIFIGEKIYSPTCNVVDQQLIQIVYSAINT